MKIISETKIAQLLYDQNGYNIHQKMTLDASGVYATNIFLEILKLVVKDRPVRTDDIDVAAELAVHAAKALWHQASAQGTVLEAPSIELPQEIRRGAQNPNVN